MEQRSPRDGEVLQMFDAELEIPLVLVQCMGGLNLPID